MKVTAFIEGCCEKKDRRKCSTPLIHRKLRLCPYRILGIPYTCLLADAGCPLRPSAGISTPGASTYTRFSYSTSEIPE